MFTQEAPNQDSFSLQGTSWSTRSRWCKPCHCLFTPVLLQDELQTDLLLSWSKSCKTCCHCTQSGGFAGTFSQFNPMTASSAMSTNLLSLEGQLLQPVCSSKFPIHLLLKLCSENDGTSWQFQGEFRLSCLFFSTYIYGDKVSSVVQVISSIEALYNVYKVTFID